MVRSKNSIRKTQPEKRSSENTIAKGNRENKIRTGIIRTKTEKGNANNKIRKRQMRRKKTEISFMS